MTTSWNPRYPYAIVVTFVAILVTISSAAALYTSFQHHYSEATAKCHKFQRADTGTYEMAKCVDPKTGILYDPDFLR